MVTDKEWTTINAAFDKGFTDDISIALRDLFALGCILHAKGQIKAGKKAIRTALRATSIHERKDNLFDQIFDSLAGNENTFLHEICPHTEFTGLLENK